MLCCLYYKRVEEPTTTMSSARVSQCNCTVRDANRSLARSLAHSTHFLPLTTLVTAWRTTTPALSTSFRLNPPVTHTFSAG